ncbi:hypothetical protein [Smaragdicoccus niigatensis]|uniref:hypothetical protein n=1 Tax=Smaragdicoccus niigatensis TaxID=359359 RepID=UPI0012DF3739|nr:hypothetical protein [Smaragdicoccus niigatensis]
MFDSLSPVEIAAVLGDDIDTRLLTELTGRDTLSILDELALAHDAIEVDGTHARFTSDGARRQLLKSVPPSRRAAVHAGATRILMAQQTAADVLKQHLDAGTPALTVAERARALVALGDALLRERDLNSARETFLAAVEPARAAGDAVTLSRAALGLGAGTVGFEVQLVDRAQLDLLDEALRALGDRDAGLAAALTARKSIALTYIAPPDERERLARTALENAPDPVTRAHALAALCDAQAGPSHRAERLEMSNEIVGIAHGAADARLELLGRRLRLVAHAESGDFTAVEADVRDYAALVQTLPEPIYAWYVPLWRASRALLDGRLDDCAHLLDSAIRHGESAGSFNCYMLTETLKWCLFSTREDESALRDIVRAMSEYSELWALVARAHVHAQVGDTDRARSLIDAVAPRLPELPFDSEWLPSLAQVAETCERLGQHAVSGWLYDQLLPYADQWVIEGIFAAARGSAHLFLGLAARAKGDPVAAQRHLEEALARHQAAGAPVLAARALALLGVPTKSAAPNEGSGTFTRDGDIWHVGLSGVAAPVRHVKGMSDIAALLRRPHEPVRAVDLIGSTAAPTSGLGPALDEQAKRAYRQRLNELSSLLADADDRGDSRASKALAAEQEALLGELSGAFGIGGRARPKGDAGEKARTAVTARIRDAIKRIEAAQPDVGRHLRLSVKTGISCSYEPERPVHWNLTS